MVGRTGFAVVVASVALTVASVAPAARPLPPDQKAAAIQALMERGDALNRLHHLGIYARPPAQELRALRLRSQALNRIYGLGAYAATADGFDWGDAGIGSAATIGVLLLAVAAAATAYRRRQSAAQAV